MVNNQKYIKKVKNTKRLITKMKFIKIYKIDNKQSFYNLDCLDKFDITYNNHDSFLANITFKNGDFYLVEPYAPISLDGYGIDNFLKDNNRCLELREIQEEEETTDAN